MIRSGEHELWDARMATNPARADFNARAAELVAALEPFRRAIEPVFAKVAQQFAEFARAVNARP